MDTDGTESLQKANEPTLEIASRAPLSETTNNSISSSSGSRSGTRDNDNFVSDFDAMLLRKKAERKPRRRKQYIDLTKENEELIDQLIMRMKNAADEDRLLNMQGKPATKKLAMLKQVTSQLIKKDLQPAFLEHDILIVLADWLSPLPNKSLPCMQLRESILRLLSDFPIIDKNRLKESGIGKAVMFLHKNKEETKQNRDRAGRLISEWARPIFNISCDFNAMTKEEWQQRDSLEPTKKRRKSVEQKPSTTETEVGLQAIFGTEKYLEKKSPKPVDKGGPYARAPLPSNKEYVIRPKSLMGGEVPTSTKPKLNRYEQQVKKMLDAKRSQKLKSAVKISIDGRKMPL